MENRRASRTVSPRRPSGVPLTLAPMEAALVAQLPEGPEWRYEPKWDGFRCLAYKSDDKIDLQSKSSKPLARYFPDVVAMLAKIKAERFVLDGELAITGPFGYAFSDLQLRLHPAASRVAKLAAASPASFILFDLLLTPDGDVLTDRPLSVRRAKLEAFYKKFGAKEKFIELSPQTDSLKTAGRWLDALGGKLDGLMAKNADDVYLAGERQMQKYKSIRTADCVVGGFRYGTDSKLVGSLLLGLYDDADLLNHVGFTSAIADDDKPALTKKLEKILAASSFTGKAPGGPSRWSNERTGEWQPIIPKLVVEVSYDHVSDDRFRHGTRLLRWRSDKAPKQCRMEQLYQPKALPMDFA